MEIKIVNKKFHTPEASDVYIGRGSALGNPFTHIPVQKTKALYQCKTRDEAVEKYGDWIREKIKSGDKEVIEALNNIKSVLDKYKSVNLVCYCAPQRCHGEIIKEIIEKEN
jgi:hypothetical protein